MNWFVHSFPTADSKTIINDSACEHVEEGISPVYVVVTEQDSFGPVGETAFCEACFAKAKAEEAEEEVFCPDCKQNVKKADTRTWKWYDFYAPQGDEPLIICKECWLKPKHQSRMARDEEEREEELSLYRRRG